MIFQGVGRVQLFGHQRFLFIGQMIQHIAPLMDLAALDRRRLAGMLLSPPRQRFATIQNIESRLAEIESAIHQIAQQLAHYGGVFGGALPDA